MKYTLPNGKQIDIERIVSVSPVRDLGPDPKSIDLSRLGFSIHLRKREIVEVVDNYHYNDWAEVRSQLNKIRDEILKLVHQGPAA
ncbi:MAG TPA: hypothetical protein PKI59_02000 [Candidatus Cloacimonadota bacterium]|nr:hypothetical protein [Candidatus Cloacimonadota bacterium]